MMYRKIVWCYIVVLALLDISLNTKLTAQGKNHGTIHETLVEGIHFQQEWKEPSAPPNGESTSPLVVEPAVLAFGPVSLGAAHARVVTLSNAANATLHLASVAGTTPDFHASFFDAKTLPPESNTTFNVVYLGRREGPVTAHLYIHTSLGVHKYTVTAEGVASEWGLWPLMGLRIPLNATVESTLTLRNPTDQPVQVTSVYSSGAWVSLALPAGGAEARAAAWLVPPRRAAPIVRLRIRPAPHHPSTAYVRIKANISTEPLVVGVEARSAAAGEFTQPLQIRLRARGHRDPAETISVYAGSSAGSPARLEAAVWGARCLPAPPAPAPAPAPAPGPGPGPAPDTARHVNGVKSDGTHVTLLKAQLEPYQEVTRVAQVTFDYAALWAGYDAAGGGAEAEAEGAWCGGVVRLGRAHLPYSLRLLKGTLAVTPAQLQFVTADESLPRAVWVRARNEFGFPLSVAHVHVPEHAARHLALTHAEPRMIPPGESAALFHVELTATGEVVVDTAIVVHTNVTDYSIPLVVYSGKLHLEWEWPGWPAGQLATAGGAEGEADGGGEGGGDGPTLHLGAAGTSQTKRVHAKVVNGGPRALCLLSWQSSLAGASFTLAACPDLAATPPDHPCRCVEAYSSAAAVLSVVMPARGGALRGSLRLATAHAAAAAAVSAAVLPGRLALPPLRLGLAAPYAWAVSPLVAESSMPLRMRVLAVRPPQPARAPPDPALTYIPPAEGEAEISEGRHTVGAIQYAPEKLCEPRCYTGLDLTTEEGVAWVSGAGDAELSRRTDRALLAARLALYKQTTTNISLHLHTTQVVQVPITGSVQLHWPRLVRSPEGGAGAGWGGLAAVGASASFAVRVANPSRSHALLLQPALGALPDHVPHVWEDAEAAICKQEDCIYSSEAFALGSWQEITREGEAGVREWGGGPRPTSPHALPFLLLPPSAEIDLTITFSPAEPSLLTAYLYLRNNLTVVEGLQLAGRGAFPSFELGGRRSGAASPLLFQVSECGENGIVRRTVTARNSGAVAMTVREWRVAGRRCARRGFSLAPCQPLRLLPNRSADLALAFAPDYTLARASAALELTTDRSRLVFQLAGAVPARLVRACGAALPRPPFEPALRSAGSLLALALLALVLAAAALDAERLLRRCRTRGAGGARAALDLRCVSAATPPGAPPAPPTPPARPPRRRKARRLDPLAESRAFERWRASLAPPRNDDSRSSDDDAAPAPLLTHQRADPRYMSAAPDDRLEPEAETQEDSEPRETVEECESEREDTDSSSPQEIEDEDDNVEEAPPPIEIASRVCQPDVSPSPAAAPQPAAEPAPRSRRRDNDARRSERRPPAETEPARPSRPPPAKHHLRKDKSSKRRERVAAAPARSSPPHSEPRGGAGAGGGVRWGASWSSVVARTNVAATPPPPLPPIGSDVRRRTQEEANNGPRERDRDRERERDKLCKPPAVQGATRSDNSLFYFNGEQSSRPDEYRWSPDRGFATPTRDFLGQSEHQESVPGGGGAYGSIGAVWGGSGGPPGWPWPAYHSAAQGAVRPPPGFGSAPGGNSVGAVGSTMGTMASNVGPVGSSVGTLGSTVGNLSNVGGMGPNVGALGSNMGALVPNSPGPVGAPVGAGAPPRGARPFDPFQSLAAIWSRTALDWRADSSDERH